MRFVAVHKRRYADGEAGRSEASRLAVNAAGMRPLQIGGQRGYGQARGRGRDEHGRPATGAGKEGR
jgi:hypothetical protein